MEGNKTWKLIFQYQQHQLAVKQKLGYDTPGPGRRMVSASGSAGLRPPSVPWLFLVLSRVSEWSGYKWSCHLIGQWFVVGCLSVPSKGPVFPSVTKSRKFGNTGGNKEMLFCPVSRVQTHITLPPWEPFPQCIIISDLAFPRLCPFLCISTCLSA